MKDTPIEQRREKAKVNDKRRILRAARRKDEHVALPAWMNDPSLLPKKPPTQG